MYIIELASNTFTEIPVQCRCWTLVVCARLFGCLGDEKAVMGWIFHCRTHSLCFT